MLRHSDALHESTCIFASGTFCVYTLRCSLCARCSRVPSVVGMQLCVHTFHQLNVYKPSGGACLFLSNQHTCCMHAVQLHHTVVCNTPVRSLTHIHHDDDDGQERAHSSTFFRSEQRPAEVHAFAATCNKRFF